MVMFSLKNHDQPILYWKSFFIIILTPGLFVNMKGCVNLDAVTVQQVEVHVSSLMPVYASVHMQQVR